MQPVSLIPLMKGAQHATLIGDHKQLPAVVTVSSIHLNAYKARTLTFLRLFSRKRLGGNGCTRACLSGSYSLAVSLVLPELSFLNESW